VPRGKADISNTALRIFLQEMGIAYDSERQLKPYQNRDFAEVRALFHDCCCYCGLALEPKRIAQDHLEPLNKTALGLHAWGNIVPACQDCNHDKGGSPWAEFLAKRAGVNSESRRTAILEYVAKYKYDPDTSKLALAASELYEEVAAIAMAIVNVKVNRLRNAL
jgi:hypothetical protein